MMGSSDLASHGVYEATVIDTFWTKSGLKHTVAIWAPGTPFDEHKGEPCSKCPRVSAWE